MSSGVAIQDLGHGGGRELDGKIQVMGGVFLALCSMPDAGHLDLRRLALYPTGDPVRSQKHFADIRVLNFLNHPPAFGEALKRFDLVDEFLA
jgi:hypothetical protein